MILIKENNNGIIYNRYYNKLKKEKFLKIFFFKRYNHFYKLPNVIFEKSFVTYNNNLIKNNKAFKLRKKKIKKTFLKKSFFNFFFFLIKSFIKKGNKNFNINKIYYIFFKIKKLLIKKSFIKLFIFKFFIIKKIFNKFYIRYNYNMKKKFLIFKKIFNKKKNSLFLENIFFILINILKNQIVN